MKPKPPPVLTVIDTERRELLDEMWRLWKLSLERTGRTTVFKLVEVLGIPEGFWWPIAGNQIDRHGGAVEAALLGMDADHRANCIVAAGPPGNGKTLAASMWLLNEFLGDPDDASADGLFVNASRLDGYGKDVDELEVKCLDVAFLALDDVGTGKSSSAIASRRIEDLLCQRIDRERPTFVTTNLAPEDFFSLDTMNLEPEQIWPTLTNRNRLADRIAGDTVGWVTCLEPSRRRRTR